MDNLNILLKYLVNSDDVTRIAHAAGVEEDVVEKTCVLVFDTLIPTDFTRQEGSHLEKKEGDVWVGNFEGVVSDVTCRENYTRDSFRIGTDTFGK